MAIDLFETRTMLEALRQMQKPRTFLKSTFFGNEEYSQSEYVDIDIIKGKRRMAPFVNPVMEGKVVERLGRSTNSFKPPYLKPKMVTTAEDILKRQPGAHIYEGNMPPLEKAALQLGEDMVELIDQIIRRVEWMCASALNTGKIVVTGEGVDAEIDFQMGATHLITLTGTDRWNKTNSDPIQNLKDWKRMIEKDSGLTPNRVIMGVTAVDAFVNHEKVKSALDTRRIDLGQINPDLLPDGVTYYGFIRETGCDIYGYSEWYVDDTGAENPMVPDDRVWMGSTNARASVLYGAIMDLEVGQASVPYFPKSWIVKDPSARWLLMQSAPVACLHQVDGFVSAKVA